MNDKAIIGNYETTPNWNLRNSEKIRNYIFDKNGNGKDMFINIDLDTKYAKYGYIFHTTDENNNILYFTIHAFQNLIDIEDTAKKIKENLYNLRFDLISELDKDYIHQNYTLYQPKNRSIVYFIDPNVLDDKFIFLIKYMDELQTLPKIQECINTQEVNEKDNFIILAPNIIISENVLARYLSDFNYNNYYIVPLQYLWKVRVNVFGCGHGTLYDLYHIQHFI